LKSLKWRYYPYLLYYPTRNWISWWSALTRKKLLRRNWMVSLKWNIWVPTKRMFGMNIVKNWDKDKLVLSRKWWSSLRCLMLWPLPLFWIITQNFQLCNLLNPRREKENGEHFLCKCGRKHHIWHDLQRIRLNICDWQSKSVYDKFESSAFASFEVGVEILDRVTKKMFKIHKRKALWSDV
jgi:hypothetical protein